MSEVFIDDREGSRDLASLPPLNEVAEVVRLDSGDAMMIGNGPDGPVTIGVEVKSAWDLLNSIHNGRIVTQIRRMKTTYDECWLLTYGPYRSSRIGQLELLRGNQWKPIAFGKQKISYGYVEHFLMGADVQLGIHVKQVGTVKEAAYWLAALNRWWSKPWTGHRSMRKFDVRKSGAALPPEMDDPRFALRAGIAKELPGIKFERAQAVAAHFGSVREMINSSAEEWKKVPGIGKKIAEEVEEAVS